MDRTFVRTLYTIILQMKVGINEHENTSECVHSNGYEALLTIGDHVLPGERVGIKKHHFSIGKADTTFLGL